MSSEPGQPVEFGPSANHQDAPPVQPSAAGPWAGAAPGWPAQPVAERSWSGYAIASLVFGILGFACCLWMLGIGFGVAALNTIPKRNERGKGLAIAGIVLSLLSFVASLTSTVYLYENGHSLIPVPGQRGSSQSFGKPGTVSVFKLFKGDCFVKESGDQTVKRVRLVPCDEPHYGEVFANTALADATYPGKDQVIAEAKKRCRTLKSAYAKDSWALPDSVDIRFFYPLPDTWNKSSERGVTCMFVDSKGDRTGSLRQDPSKLTPEQTKYLDAVEPVTEIAAPDTKPAQDPAAYRLWADTRKAAAEKELRDLQAVSWSDQAAKPMAELEAAIRMQIAHLQAAAYAPDTETMERELATAGHASGRGEQAAVRAALGLPVTTGGDGPAPKPTPSSGAAAV